MRVVGLWFTLSLLFFACNNSSKDRAADKEGASTPSINDPGPTHSLIGKWKPVEVNMTNIDDAKKKILLEDAVIEFGNNGQYISSLRESINYGDFVVNEKEGILTTTVDGTDELYKLEWVDEFVVLTNDKGSVKMKRIN